MVRSRPERRAQIALDIERDRNRALLTELFGTADVVEFSGTVPDGTDLCVVDEAAFERAPERFADWRTQQTPRFAPVVLLVESPGQNPWDTFEETLSTSIDSILEIPVSKVEFSTRVERLLQMRDISRQLTEEQQLMESVFESSPLAKIVFRSDGRIVRANRRAAETMGVERSKLVGADFNALDWTALDADGAKIPDEELPLAKVLETGEPLYGYELVLSFDGREDMWAAVNMAPVREGSGEIVYVVAVVEDITVRQTQAMELERQTDLFHKAEDIANVGAWEYDVRTGESWNTRGVTRIHGLPEDADLTPEASLQQYHPEDRGTIRTAFERTIDECESYDVEARLVGADGEQRWVRTRGEPQVEEGEVIRVRGTIQDITDRKERELELEQMTHAVDAAPIGITLTDPAQDDNPLIYVNDGFVELTGYSRSEALGRNCRFLQGENTNPDTVAKVRRAIDAEEPVSVDFQNYRADGTMFWNHLEIAPIRDADGELLNYIGFQQDATARVERHRQLDILDRYLRHNLRNKMNVVEGVADLIRRDADLPISAYGDTIWSAATSLLTTMAKQRVVTQILKRDPDAGAVELMKAVRTTVERIRREHPDASISVSGPDAVTVAAIPQLPMAIEEVVRNAIEHAADSSPTVTLEITARDGEVVVRIADDGPGLPEMEVDVLSSPESESDVYHGQGLGLWMVWLAVSRSGGKIRFEELSPTGTAVTIRLRNATLE